jgi:hypothetical protein
VLNEDWRCSVGLVNSGGDATKSKEEERKSRSSETSNDKITHNLNFRANTTRSWQTEVEPTRHPLFFLYINRRLIIPPSLPTQSQSHLEERDECDFNILIKSHLDQYLLLKSNIGNKIKVYLRYVKWTNLDSTVFQTCSKSQPTSCYKHLPGTTSIFLFTNTKYKYIHFTTFIQIFTQIIKQPTNNNNNIIPVYSCT